MCDHEQSDITCVCICITKAVILRGGWSEIMGMEGSKPVPRDSPTHSAASQRLIIALFFLILCIIDIKGNFPEHILIRINSFNPNGGESKEISLSKAIKYKE